MLLGLWLVFWVFPLILNTLMGRLTQAFPSLLLGDEVIIGAEKYRLV